MNNNTNSAKSIKLDFNQLEKQLIAPSLTQINKIKTFINTTQNQTNKQRAISLLKSYKNRKNIKSNVVKEINSIISKEQSASDIDLSLENVPQNDTQNQEDNSISSNPLTASIQNNTQSQQPQESQQHNKSTLISTQNNTQNKSMNVSPSPANAAKVTVTYQGKTSEFTVTPHSTSSGGKRKSHKKRHHKKRHHKNSHTKKRNMRKISHKHRY